MAWARSDEPTPRCTRPGGSIASAVRKALLLLAVVALVGAGCNVSPYAAVVNGTTISRSSLDNDLAAVRGDRLLLQAYQANAKINVLGTGKSAFDSGFVGAVLERRIEAELVHQAVMSKGIHVTHQELLLATPDAVASAGGQQSFGALPPSYRNELIREEADALSLASRLVGANISQAAIAAYYQAHQAQFTSTCISVLVSPSQAAAAALRAKIAAGASFASVAQASSIDPTTAARGGDAGCVQAGQLTPAFQFIATLPTGQISQPVQTQPGWILVEVTSRPQQPLAQVTPTVVRALLGNAQKALTSYYQAALTHGHVVVDPRYGRFIRHGDQVVFQPPSGPSMAVLAGPGGFMTGAMTSPPAQGGSGIPGQGATPGGSGAPGQGGSGAPTQGGTGAPPPGAQGGTSGGSGAPAPAGAGAPPPGGSGSPGGLGRS
ncbi:MAG: hypothetical protein DLM54_05345 [Acidimicrobiales bacterium]|nr:MAG: hypothetical protein DLM54_05345 [Acidimicrobiales bacterium]